MKLRLIWIGKTKRAAFKELISDYKARIAKFAQIEITELKDRKDAGSDPRRVIEKEAQDILAATTGDQFVVALDERGRELDSMSLAEFIEKHRREGTKQLTFVLGGHDGLADMARKRAGFVLALSRMTLTHEFARVLLLEQVYRAFTIIHDLPYQK
jgi:23S rRNA (pseudouridine1915-N3)-methyltransferase